ncbi:transcriptional regulator nanR [Escherichia coli DEC6D]|nr:transcriptional regulator nanR [Escherichia coli DEC6D]
MSAVHHQKPSLMGYQALLKIFYLQLMASRILKDYASF